jgi:acetoin utilization deacetylase AcuC-like enzyme
MDEAHRMNEKERHETALVFDAKYKDHLTGTGHPERPARLDAVYESLEKNGLLATMTRLQPEMCESDQLLSCHGGHYVAIVQQDVGRLAPELSTGDTTVCPESFDIAKLAVGGVLRAVDSVCTGEVSNVFCAVRPPGHHATATRGMGFCVFNNIALGARHAQKKHGIGKVLIVDWDVHHGNGTQDIFYDDESVFFFSTHQWPWYPGSGDVGETGQGKGLGATLNQPLPAGSGRDELVDAFAQRLLPTMNRYRPELVMISAGFDSRIGDPLGQFTLTDEDFAELTRMVMDVASNYAEGRVVSVLEGGYSLEGLGKAVAAHVRALMKPA